MYNFFATFCLVAGLGAQPATSAPAGSDDPAAYSAATVARANGLTRALAGRVPLDEAQYIRIRALHLRMLAERQALAISLSGADPAARDQALAGAQQRYETALSALLRPAQLVAYQGLRSSFTAHRL
ncbi:hypothetical protein [Hymenobacter sp. PAMC 26628]|uniref:hypothetical protein n=1 Tax=Hymenobacter sp. PAMC 26628 TaxID=1484118 RepID=UPI0007703A49|nr:hypothetical protein [Hymenobacter sp. PAMC 26628]AMJ65414.1 hypothetical protein AXW84_08235 [Hymenobacter sp. PAMC 26628]